MKFLFFPNFRHEFEYRILDGLAYELRRSGHEARVAWRPAHSHVVARLAKFHDVDVVFQVNRARPLDEEFPDHTRHISWYQDCRKQYIEDAVSSAKDGDLIYYMADIESLTGIKPDFPVPSSLLAPAVDRRRVGDISTSRNVSPKLDFSMVGTIMLPAHMDVREDTLAFEGQDYPAYFRWFMRKNQLKWSNPKTLWKYLSTRKQWRIFYAATTAKVVMETHFSPLDGVSDYAKLDEAMSEILGEYSDSHWNKEDYKIIYLRLLNRILIARYILDISSDVKFYGGNWELHDEFKNYAGGFLHNQGELQRLFQNTKIVVHDNPDGCNLHDRVFQAMACGKLTMVGSSQWDNLPGGFCDYFEPDVHFVGYTHDTFHDQARKWLRDEKKRFDVGVKAHELVMAEHTYRNRVQQILTGLNGSTS